MLEIKRLTLADLDDYYEMNKDKLTANLQGFKELESLEEARLILSQVIRFKREFKITKDNTFIGTISFTPITLDRNISTNSVMLGYGLKPVYQNQGLMSSFLKDVIEIIFFTTHFDTIFVGSFIENERSSHVISKYFTYFKEESIYFDPLSKYKRSKLYYLKRSDYLRLETDNFFLRPFYLTDLEDYFEFASEKETMELALLKTLNTTREAKNNLEELVKDKSISAIVRIEDNKVVGLFKEDDLDSFCFLGFLLGSKYQHQGIMSEVLIEFEEKRNYQYLTLGILEANDKCQALAKKLDYHYVSDLSLNEQIKLKIYIKELRKLC